MTTPPQPRPAGDPLGELLDRARSALDDCRRAQDALQAALDDLERHAAPEQLDPARPATEGPTAGHDEPHRRTRWGPAPS